MGKEYVKNYSEYELFEGEYINGNRIKNLSEIDKS